MSQKAAPLGQAIPLLNPPDITLVIKPRQHEYEGNMKERRNIRRK
jgi:hypothetical protein